MVFSICVRDPRPEARVWRSVALCEAMHLLLASSVPLSGSPQLWLALLRSNWPPVRLCPVDCWEQSRAILPTGPSHHPGRSPIAPLVACVRHLPAPVSGASQPGDRTQLKEEIRKAHGAPGPDTLLWPFPASYYAFLNTSLSAKLPPREALKQITCKPVISSLLPGGLHFWYLSATVS